MPPGDAAALADAIAKLLTDDALRSRIGAAGYRTVVERYSIDAQVKRTQLFDLKRDPYELRDLSASASHTATRRGLERQLRGWQERVKDPLLTR